MKIKLYYINILKKYIDRDIVKNFEQIPKEIIDSIKLEEDKLIELYNKSEYTIITQYKSKNFSKEEWEDLFYLIKKGHFILNNMQIKDAINYYNKNTNRNFMSYEEIINYNDKSRYQRLLKRFNV